MSQEIIPAMVHIYMREKDLTDHMRSRSQSGFNPAEVEIGSC